ncbi:hypothetical protein BST81_16840 [Leptolyngbya sp. 'hensonii']|uniref:peptidoglycan DD-metalloendopeptidase family protein n=1 Tax=Leptolyngbya sp. 'hensonii' TaxID=1922337 RepID=UPI00094F6820|nr:peptidoglycan DD-metalloendopeptidase family protein [Leptolyngbya sp. 'hensonii']OLP17456.1 hypothetical protein BST81_16840 [Leptolyngbya sp. 'hensonii']
MRLRQILLTWLLALLLVLPLPSPVWAQSSMPLGQQLFNTTGGQIPVSVLDINGLTIRNFPPIQLTPDLLGKLTQISPLIDLSDLQPAIGQWVPVGQILPIGSAFGTESLDFATTAALGGIDLNSISLNDIGGFKQLPLGNFAQGIPNLGDLKLSDAPAMGIAALQAQGIDPSQLATDNWNQLLQRSGLVDLKVADAMQSIPGLSAMKLTQIDPKLLSTLSLDQGIPGLSKTTFSLIPGAAQVPVAGVPGLTHIPVASLPQPLTLIPAAIPIRMDVMLGPQESNRTRAVSGTMPDQTLTLQPLSCTQNCSHVEIIDMGSGKYTGYAWMTGDQQGPDCFGSLCNLFGSTGPVGSHPYGPAVRVVLRHTSEAVGTVQASIAFRFCATLPFEGLTCSAYNGLEIPISSLKEGQTFVMSEPGAYVGQAPALPGFYSDNGSGGNNTCDIGSSIPVLSTQQQAISQAIINAAPSAMRSAAAQAVPRVLSACLTEGITDSAQLAYIMGTMQVETSMGAAMTENAATACSSDCTGYHGRGYGQLTGIDNYRKASQWTGVDLVSNPNQAADPALAAKIMCHGMKIGGFTENGPLNQYIPPGSGTSGFYRARDMVNPGDSSSNGCHSCVASDATTYYKAISQAQQAAANSNQPQATGQDATANQPQPSNQSAASGCGSSNQAPVNGWCDPLPGGIQTHPFGEYPHGGPPPHVHMGIDIAGNAGATVYAAADGVVDETRTTCPNSTDCGCGGGYGNFVVLRHPNSWLTLYGHNARPLVKAGQSVKCGQAIAIQGNSGCSFGDHVHFETNLGNDANHISPNKAGVPHMHS